MKMRWLVLPVVVAAVLFGGERSAKAYSSFSVGISIGSVRDFHEPLAPYGYWVELRDYGRCWYPAYIGRDWRPYSDGHWEWTDEGWYWVSDEPWAWATYHYGRWVWDSYYGWVWVPDVEWGPAWVAWREGGGYIGWAPLPPRCEYGVGGVLLIERIHWHPHAFMFVEHRHFCERVRPTTVIVNNTTIINKTVNITNIQRVDQNTVVRRNGPDFDRVRKDSPRPIEKVSAANLWRERSERVLQRATQEHVTAPPVVTEPTPPGLAKKGGLPPGQAKKMIVAPETPAAPAAPATEQRVRPRYEPPQVIRGGQHEAQPAPSTTTVPDKRETIITPPIRSVPTESPKVEPSEIRRSRTFGGPQQAPSSTPAPEKRETVVAPPTRSAPTESPRVEPSDSNRGRLFGGQQPPSRRAPLPPKEEMERRSAPTDSSPANGTDRRGRDRRPDTPSDLKSGDPRYQQWPYGPNQKGR